MKTVYSFADEKMTKTISALKSEYASIRAGRASAAWKHQPCHDRPG